MAILVPLVEDMTKILPEDRPTIDEAIKKFNDIKDSCNQSVLSQRLRPAESEWFVSRILNDFEYHIRDLWWIKNVKAVELPPFV